MTNKIDDMDINTWKKVEKTASNAGYRDGISDGREVNFQTYFDKGYELGFKTGFTLGCYKGKINLQKNEDKTKNTLLEKTKTGNCQLCSIENIESEEISNLENIQNANHENVLQSLNNDYPEINLTILSK